MANTTSIPVKINLQVTEINALVLHPGDAVIFAIPLELDPDIMDNARDQLSALLPDGIEAVFVYGAQVTGIRPATTTEGDR